MQKHILFGLVTLLCLGGCAKSADDIKNDFKRELLAGLTTTVIIPGYQRFIEAADKLQADIQHYCENPTGDLAPLQDSWRAGMTAWQETAAYTFGPVTRHDLPALIDYQAIKKNKIQYWLEPGRMASAEAIRTYSVQGKGLTVLEYLLFEPGIRRSGAEYCAYLGALTADIQANARRIVQLWMSESADYTSVPANAAVDMQHLDEFLNAVLQQLELVKDEKLGIPLGKKNNGVMQFAKAESLRSGHSLHNVRANMVSLQDIFTGGRAPGGTGLQSCLQTMGNLKTAADMEHSLQRLMQELAQLPADFPTALSEQPARVETVYSMVSMLTRTVETEVLPAFDVQPGFNARDGD